MLRRFSAAAPSVSSKALLASAVESQAVRGVFVYTEQSEALGNTAKAAGHASNVWAEENDFKRAGIELKPDEKPTEARVVTRTEYVNFADLPRAAVRVASAKFKDNFPKHNRVTNLASGKELPRHIVGQLFKKAAPNMRDRRDSHLWVSKRVAQRVLGARDTQKKVVVYGSMTLRLYNAAQCADPAKFATLPTNCTTREAFNSKQVKEALAAAVAANAYPTGLFFTKEKVANLKLEVADGAAPVKVHSEFTPSAGTRVALWNLDQLEGGAAAAENKGRVAVDVPTYFGSGKHVAHDELKAACAGAGHASHYWLDRTELLRSGLKFKEGEKPLVVTLPPRADAPAPETQVNDTEYFSVHQLKNPEEGFKLAGSEPPKRPGAPGAAGGARDGGDRRRFDDRRDGGGRRDFQRRDDRRDDRRGGDNNRDGGRREAVRDRDFQRRDDRRQDGGYRRDFQRRDRDDRRGGDNDNNNNNNRRDNRRQEEKFDDDF